MSNNDPFAVQPEPAADAASGGAPNDGPSSPQAKVPAIRIVIALCIFLAVGIGGLVVMFQSDKPKVTGLQGGTTVKVDDPNLGKPKDLKQIVDVMSAEVGTLRKRLDQNDQNQARVLESLGAIERRLGIAETGLRGVASQNPEDLDRQRLIEGLADAQRAIIPDATVYLNNLARDRGLFGPDDAQPLFETWCQARLTNAGSSVRDLFTICRVRREPLTDGHVRAAPALAAQRETKKVKASDLPGLARMVWEARGSYPVATPGQMLALGQMVGQMAGGLPQEGTPLAQANVGSPAALPMPVAQPALVAGYTVLASDVPTLLAAAAPLLPDIDGSDMLRSGATMPFAATLGEGVRGVVTDRAYAELLASVTGALGGFDAEALTLTGVAAADVPRVSATVRGLLLGDLVAQARLRGQESAVTRQAIVQRFSEAQKLLDERFLASLKGYQPVRWTLALADRLGVRHPDFARVNVQALDIDARKAMDDVLARGVLPADLVPAFAVHAPLSAAAAQLDHSAARGDATVITRQAVYRSAVYLLAAQQSAHTIRGRLIQTYATLFGTSTRNWSDTAVEAERQAHVAIVEGLAANDMSLDAAGVTHLVPIITRHAVLAAEQHLATTAVRDHVNASIDKGAVGAAAGLVKRVRSWADEQITSRIVAPFDVDRLSSEAASIRQDVEAMLSGRKRLPQDTSLKRASASSVRRGGGIVITSFETEGGATTRMLTIPAGSYGEAKLFSGADIELGGQQKEMLINLDYSWRGPSDTVLKMRNLRIIGIATAQGGPARASVALRTMSYVFPSGRVWSSPVSGYVVDHVHGMHGVVGEWNLNIKEVLPLAGGTSILAGIGAALTPNSDTIVNSSTTVVTTDGTALQKGASEAFNKSVDPLVKMTDRILSQCNASISVPNGQPITCVLTDAVQIEIPLDEFHDVVETVSVTNAPGGFSHAR